MEIMKPSGKGILLKIQTHKMITDMQNDSAYTSQNFEVVLHPNQYCDIERVVPFAGLNTVYTDTT